MSISHITVGIAEIQYTRKSEQLGNISSATPPFPPHDKKALLQAIWKTHNTISSMADLV
jgi:hypothetical protein